jgi:hypothetical protein
VLLKTVALFLVAMFVLGLFGGWKFPKNKTKLGSILSAKKCKTCGQYLIGSKPCSCSDA